MGACRSYPSTPQGSTRGIWGSGGERYLSVAVRGEVAGEGFRSGGGGVEGEVAVGTGDGSMSVHRLLWFGWWCPLLLQWVRVRCW